MADKIQKTGQQPERIDPGEDPTALQVGRWYWVRDVDEEEKEARWLGCVVHVGSNYAELEGPSARHCEGHQSERVHFDEFAETCEFVPDPDTLINAKIGHHQRRAQQLMGQVQELTALLGVQAGQKALPETSETHAITLHQGKKIEEYKTALVKAKDKDLPELFKEIEVQNKLMGQWMGAKLIPLQAVAKGLKPIIKKVEARIFNVELYAGLVEEVVEVAAGKPAERDEPICLFQRRCYMDEECLARYETGGMEFEDIADFDEWIAKKENRDRLLPASRCVVAFKVRRIAKKREFTTWREFVNFAFSGGGDADKLTFLYMRNGERLYRLSTGIEFGEKLFPDRDRHVLMQSSKGQIYALDHGEKLITQADYEQMVQEEQKAEEKAEREYLAALAEYEKIRPAEEAAQTAFEKAMEEYKAKKAEYDKLYAVADDKARERGRKTESGGRCWTPPNDEEVGMERPSQPERPKLARTPWKSHVSHEAYRYTPWNSENVYYDDIGEAVKEEMDRHNRLVLVLQGILDRSPVMHPHPPWKIWTEEGFQQALALVFDDSRALTSGEAPDFEAYRARLNASIGVGSLTVGQVECWQRLEAEKENRRRASNWRTRDSCELEHFKPYGNPGPGKIAKVEVFSKSKGCTYRWSRVRQGWLSKYDRWGGKTYDDRIACSVTVPVGELLNVSAYKPGDFRQFFDDPRTRADYLKWAPLLLEAEEYHAGNRKLWDGDEETED